MSDSPRSWAKMLARAMPILARMPDAPLVMVEVGVYTGFMAEYLLNQRVNLTWHGVDNWLAASDQPAAYRRSGDVHARLSQSDQDAIRRQAVARLAKFDGRATIHHAGSPEAADRFEDASLDLVFLDARHDHDGVLEDCRAWWPKVKPGGWLSGHDIGNTDPRFTLGVDRAVMEFSDEIGVSFEVDEGLTWFVKKQ